MEYVQYNEDVYKDMCMQLMEDEQYIVLNTEYPELILPQTCAVVEFCGERALNRCPDEGLSHVSHSELRGKIEPFRPGRGGCPKDRRGNFAWKNVTQFSCNADKNFCVVFDCKSETQPFDNNQLDSSILCEDDEKELLNMLSFSAQRAGNPAD